MGKFIRKELLIEGGRYSMYYGNVANMFTTDEDDI